MAYTIQPIEFFFVNAYMIRCENTTVLFDTGAVVKPEELSGFLKDRDIDPKSIDYIIISHAHWDHFALAAQWKKLSGAKLICHRNGADFLKTGNKDLPFDFNYTPEPELYALFKEFMMGLNMRDIPPVQPDILVDDEGLDLHELGIPGKLIYTPGHADSAISLVMDNRVCFTGDTVIDLHTVQCLTDSFPEKSYSLNWIRMDNETIERSARKLIEAADTFYGGHGVPFRKTDIENIISEVSSYEMS